MSNFKLLLQRQSLQSRRDCECSVEGTVNSNGTGQTDAQASIFYTADRLSGADSRTVTVYLLRPQHCLYFLPLPQGHGSFG